MDARIPSLACDSVTLIERTESILQALPELERAAFAWGQQALVQELPFYMSASGKSPLLLLFRADESSSQQIQGAAFFYAHGGPLFGKCFLSNADRFGRIGVFGPSPQRAQIALAASQFLLRTGAAVVRFSFRFEEDGPSEQTVGEYTQVLALRSQQEGEEWVLRSHELFVDLTLYPDLDRTLNQLGRRTRRNLREITRRGLAELGCTFIPSVVVTLDEFLQLNHRCARPASSRVARWRYRKFRGPSALISGVQASDGRWLCLAGSRISADTLIVGWQMNDLSFAHYSPSLLMRAFLMQHFGAQGLRALFFEGGTSHRMAGRFNKRTVHFLQAHRESLPLSIFRRALMRVFPKKAITKTLFGYG